MHPLSNKPEKKPTVQQNLFIDAMLGEACGNPKIAADIAGFSQSYAYDLVSKLKDSLIEGARDILALHGIKAAYELVKALDDEEISPNVKVKMRAAEQILDRIGVHKNEQTLSLEDTGAILLFPAKNPIKENVDETN